MFAAIVLAAGMGTRLGASKPKNLLQLGRETIVERSVRLLSQTKRFDNILVLYPPGYKEHFLKLHFPPEVSLAQGSSSPIRSESVKLALDWFTTNTIVPKYIAVHDGVRCFFSESLVNRVLDAVVEYKAVTAALPLSDTLHESSREHKIIGTVPRDGKWLIQTPQVFEFSLLKKAHQIEHPDVTDDAGLVSLIHPVHLVEGERGNLKVTTYDDYDLVRKLVTLEMFEDGFMGEVANSLGKDSFGKNLTGSTDVPPVGDVA